MSKIQALECSYSTLSSNELMAKVIPDYCIDEPVSCLFWERGCSDTYEIRCVNTRYSLRVYRNAINTRDEIDFEVAALNYLHDKGFPVAFPIARKSGGYITEVSAPEGIRYVLISAFATGDMPDYDSLEDFRLYGESVAQLHTLSDSFETSHKRPELDLKMFTEKPYDLIAPHVSHRSEELAFLKQCLETARSDIERVGVSGMDYGFCHGDVHGGNAHLHEGVLTHFDFEECGFGFRLFDLATFKWGSVGSSKKGPEQWAAFVEGYESIRKISEADFQLLDTFILLRNIWLIAFHMRNADDFGGELTSDGYIDHHWRKLRRYVFGGIGAELKKENENIEVVRLVNGGSAESSEQVNAGDIIASVGDGEDGDMIETKNLSLHEVTDLIVGPNGSSVRLGIRSADAPVGSSLRVVSVVRARLS